MWGPCLDHNRAILWPFLGMGATRYSHQCEIWHDISLGLFFRIQEEPIWRVMWEPCLGHKKAISWPFPGKGTRAYTPQFQIWHGASLDTWIEIQEDILKDHVRTLWWLEDTSSYMKFGMEQPWAQQLRFRTIQFEGQCWDYVFVIKGPYSLLFGKWARGYTQ